MGQILEEVSPEAAFQKISDWLSEADLIEKVYYDDYDWSDFPDLKLTDSDVKKVHEYNEGDGNSCGAIFFIEKYNVYFELSGWYSSWDSSNIDTICRVYPHSVYRIEYLAVPQSIEQLNKEYEQFYAHWKSSNQA